jgi:hypothetical protein
MALLTDLSTIIVEQNSIRGSIPESWSIMSSLSTLRLGFNQLEGTFPEHLLLNNAALDTIHLGDNKFSGTLPSSLTRLPLRDLRLERNQFNGTIPSELATITTLRKFYESIVSAQVYFCRHLESNFVFSQVTLI